MRDWFCTALLRGNCGFFLVYSVYKRIIFMLAGLFMNKIEAPLAINV